MDNYYSTRKNVFERIQDASTTTKILLSLLMACFTGIMAQIIIPLPWTPVPITAQTFAVLCSGLFLGKKYGCLSQILYIVLGVAFIPWFGGMAGGLETLLGSTGGFLIGFVIASYFIGAISAKYADARNRKLRIDLHSRFSRPCIMVQLNPRYSNRNRRFAHDGTCTIHCRRYRKDFRCCFSV